MQAPNNTGAKKLRLSGSLICMLAAFGLMMSQNVRFALVIPNMWWYMGDVAGVINGVAVYSLFALFGMFLVCSLTLLYLCFLYPKKKWSWCLPVLLLLFFMTYLAYTCKFKSWMEHREINSYYNYELFHKMVVFSAIKQVLIWIVGLVSIACSLLGFRRYHSVSTSKVFGGAAGLLVFYEFVQMIIKCTSRNLYSSADCAFTVAICLFLISVFLLARKGECPILIKAAVAKAEPEPEKKEIVKPSENSAEDQLLLLKAKLDAGMITEEEYQKQRLAVLQNL